MSKAAVDLSLSQDSRKPPVYSIPEAAYYLRIPLLDAILREQHISLAEVRGPAVALPSVPFGLVFS